MDTIAIMPPPRNGTSVARAPDCCANCQHFLQQSAGDPHNLKAPSLGICRRYPPNAQVVGMQPNPMDPRQPPMPQVARALVPVQSMEWCGEHARLQ